MADREDEFWAGQKEPLRYCLEHKHYYLVTSGCQFCGYAYVASKQPKVAESNNSEIPHLIKCKACSKESLYWNKKLLAYECLNISCGRLFPWQEMGNRPPEPHHEVIEHQSVTSDSKVTRENTNQTKKSFLKRLFKHKE